MGASWVVKHCATSCRLKAALGSAIHNYLCHSLASECNRKAMCLFVNPIWPWCNFSLKFSPSVHLCWILGRFFTTRPTCECRCRRRFFSSSHFSPHSLSFQSLSHSRIGANFPSCFLSENSTSNLCAAHTETFVAMPARENHSAQPSRRVDTSSSSWFSVRLIFPWCFFLLVCSLMSANHPHW